MSYFRVPIEALSIFGISTLPKVSALLSSDAPIFTLKGHATSVNCFGIFPEEPDRLASGSYDTHIKLWDIRNKNNTGMLKHHTKPINSIDISPDGRYLLSGS